MKRLCLVVVVLALGGACGTEGEDYYDRSVDWVGIESTYVMNAIAMISVLGIIAAMDRRRWGVAH